jgi:DNA-binding CsgD family transcriptional regulator
MQRTLDDKELIFLNQLFAKLYEDENYEKAFSTFLEDLKEIVRFRKGDIYFYRNENEHITFDDFIFVEWEKDSLNSYLNEYADIDDVLPVVALKQPMMFRSSDVFLHDERMKTKYYNELLLPEGMHHSIEGNIYNDGNGSIAGIGIHRPDEFGDFSQKELEIMKLSRPHLQNIARKYIDRRQELEVYPTKLSVLCDIDDIGLCILDNSFELIDCNLYKNKFIKTEHVGEMMRSLITLCKNLDATIKNKKESDSTEDNKRHSRIIIGSTSYYAEVTYKAISKEEGRFITMIYNSSDMIEKIISEACDRFNLTEREGEILKCVIRGLSNADVSRKLFISVPTVKKHLANIYEKMDIEGKHQVISTIVG